MIIDPGTTLNVLLENGKSADLFVEEYQPVDRAAYQWEAGWSCYDPVTDVEYFVARGGEVYVQPENRCVGVHLGLAYEAEALQEDWAS